MSSQATARLLTEVLDRLRPHLPDDPEIEATPHRKWTTLQRAELVNDDRGRPQNGSISGITVRSLRPWFPFPPRKVQRRPTAQSAGETLPDTASQRHVVDGVEDPHRHFAPRLDFEVKAANGRDGVVVTYQPPTSRPRI